MISMLPHEIQSLKSRIESGAIPPHKARGFIESMYVGLVKAPYPYGIWGKQRREIEAAANFLKTHGFVPHAKKTLEHPAYTRYELLERVDSHFLKFPDQEAAKTFANRIITDRSVLETFSTLSRSIGADGRKDYWVKLRIGIPRTWLSMDYSSEVTLEPGQLVDRKGQYQKVVEPIKGTIHAKSCDFYSVRLPDYSLAHVSTRNLD